MQECKSWRVQRICESASVEALSFSCSTSLRSLADDAIEQRKVSEDHFQSKLQEVQGLILQFHALTVRLCFGLGHFEAVLFL
jgi:hypothetical protein